MAEGFQVDLDGEQVLFDGIWYSKEDLAQKIRAMVDGGDYRVSRPSAALEALQNALLGLRSLTLRLPAEHAEWLAAEAARQGMPVGAFTRELLMQVLQTTGLPPAPAPSAFQGGPVAAMNDVPTAAEAAGAIPLTPKRRLEDQVRGDQVQGSQAETDWFKRR